MLQTHVDDLANALGLGALLARLGPYELVDHWQQGEFHHDVVLRARLADRDAVLVVATNCNGGVKEVLALDAVPDRYALWLARCPDNTTFRAQAQGEEPKPLAAARTQHWFDPCELLVDDARSELKPTCRKPAPGGGWQPA